MEKNFSQPISNTRRLRLLSGVFGAGINGAGFINLLWSSEPGFGVFLLLLSLLYFLPVHTALANATIHTISLPNLLKIILGVLTTWVVLSQGALPKKIALLQTSLSF